MVEVRWRDGRGNPAQRIHDRLSQGTDNYPLAPSAQTTTNPTRCITTIHYGASQSSDRGHGNGPDPVAAAIAAKGGIQR
jgi:hypothetical protein